MTIMGCLSLALIALTLSFGEAEVREAFHKESLTKEDLQSIIEKGTSSKSLIVQSYVGLCETMMADHVFLPTTKFTHFNRGKTKVERGIAEDSENPEFRYIRLMVQLNSPSLLGYSENINYDMEMFVKNIGNYGLSEKWKLQFITKLMSANAISDNHKDQLQKIKVILEKNGNNSPQ